MRFFHRFRGVLAISTLALAFCLASVDFADARRGGGFGSRGLRTFNSPAATRTAPKATQPINQSMTPRQQTTQPNQAGARQGAAQTNRGGMFGGMFGGLLGGLMLGGLIGMLMGHGIGGMAGMLGFLVQILLIGLVVMFVMRWLRGRQNPAMAGASGGGQAGNNRFDYAGGSPGSGAGTGAAPTGYGAPHAMADEAGDDLAPVGGADEIGIGNEDLDQFEQLLAEIQAAFTREDYAGLRARCTPEIVSYLSEELSQNAVSGKRNEVLDVRLLQGDLAESWREGEDEYATVALRYESIDVMRDRQSGAIVEGEEHPTETTEVWTFVRPVGGSWKLSAIQDV
ncbi:MAG: Tim44 domain-containing protein [Acuticoccus sp.]